MSPHRALSWAFALVALALAVRRASGASEDRLARWGGLLLLALGAAVLATGLGALPHYEAVKKQATFLRSAALGWAFEAKLHLSVAALASALGAAAAGVGARGPWGRRAAAVALSAAAICGALSIALATRVLGAR